MDFDFITDETQREQAIEAYNNLVDQHKLELDEAVSGLKSKNAELLDEKKKIERKLREFESFDFDKANEALEFLENNKDAQLIKDGKVDELIEKRTSQLVSDHEAAINEIKGQLKEEMERAGLYENLYKTKMVEDALRDVAIKAKVRPEAITDVLLHGKNVFSLADDGSIEARDENGKLRKTEDDKVLTPANWIEGLKKVSPHYWPESRGAGAFGGGFSDENDLTAAMHRAAERGDMVEYRRLRSKQQKKK